MTATSDPIGRLRTAVDVRPGEGAAVLLLVAHACCMGIGNTFLDASASALFLSYFSIDRLPYVYIGSAVVTATLGFVFTRLESRITPARLLAGTLVTLTASLGVMYALMAFSPSRWVAVLLMMWKDVQFILSGLVLWAAAGMLFNLRQGKRLFGLVGVGDVTAIIVGGVAIRFISSAIGAVHLLPIAVAAELGSLVILTVVMRRFAPEMDDDSDATDGVAPQRGWSALLRDRYLVLLFGVSVLSYLAYYFIDFSFYARLQVMHPTAEALAGFYGLFLAASGLANLLANTFLSGPLLTRFGVQAGLLVLPALDATGALTSLGGSTAGVAILFSWAIIGTKLLDEVFRKSVEGPSYRVLYQPLAPRDRLRVQGLRESIIEPAAIGTSGVVLIVLTRFFHMEGASLVAGLVGIIIVWLVACRQLGAQYVTALRGAISRRRLDNTGDLLNDVTTLRLVDEFLEGADGPELVYALTVAESTGRPGLDARLIRALEHKDVVVREHALRALERRAPVAAVAPVRNRLRVEPVPHLRGLAARVYCGVATTDAFETVGPLIDDLDVEVREGALVGLLRHGGIDGVATARGRLRALVDSSTVDDRALAATILGEAGTDGFFRPLLTLVGDPDTRVRRLAITAAGALRSPRLVPSLVDALSEARVGDVAVAALANTGDDAVPALAELLVRESAAAPLRVRAARTLGRIGTAVAVRALTDRLEERNVVVRAAVLTALERARWRATSDNRTRVTTLLRAEAEDLVRCIALSADCGNDDPALSSALVSEVAAARARLLSIMTLLAGDQSARDVKAGLGHADAEKRAQALEVAEAVLPKPLRPLIIPLLDDLSTEERLRRLNGVVAVDRAPADERLGQLVSATGDGRTWLRAVAIRAAGLHGARHLAPDVAKARNADDLLVREIAAWSADVLAAPAAAEPPLPAR